MKTAQMTGAALVEQVLSDPDKYLEAGRRDVERVVGHDVKRRTQLLKVSRKKSLRTKVTKHRSFKAASSRTGPAER